MWETLTWILAKRGENMENVVVTVVASEDVDLKDKAKQKLNQELKESSNKGFAEPIINYLQKRIQESATLAADINSVSWRSQNKVQ